MNKQRTLAVAWRGVTKVATSQLGDIYSKIFNQESSVASSPKGNFSPSLNLTSTVSHIDKVLSSLFFKKVFFYFGICLIATMGAEDIFSSHPPSQCSLIEPWSISLTPPVLAAATVEVVKHLNCELMTHTELDSTTANCFLLAGSS